MDQLALSLSCSALSATLAFAFELWLHILLKSTLSFALTPLLSPLPTSPYLPTAFQRPRLLAQQPPNPF
ncbi:hypothetical protein T439DRAFT_325135 [Meredithblackwellia eburnea MCA 4105]